MKTSIFKKYFSVIAAILFICTTLMSGILVFFLRSVWITDKNNLLKNNVMIISSNTQQMFSSATYMSELNNRINIISQTASADIYIVDTAGNYVTCADNFGNCNSDVSVPDRILNKTYKGSYNEIGDLGGVYKEKCYTVGGVLQYNGQPVGYIYASVPSSTLEHSIYAMLKVVLASTITFLLVSLIIVSITTARITKPLRLMTQAAQKMEQGDFLQQIPVNHKDEIGQLSEAFNSMAKSLASLEFLQRNFISSVSHELKTPMTTISGFVDGILDGTIAPDEEKKYLSVVSDETKRLSRLVNSMLQMTRLESDENKLNVTTFNFTDIVARTLISFEQKIEEKKLQILGTSDMDSIYLSADEDMIYQVVYNLTENAIKFTDENGEITINVKSAEDGVHFLIKNTGEGLNEHELAGIFERFYKTDRSRNNDKTGVGFGLHIVKTIVNKHFGKITASSSLGEYTQFEVYLPNQKEKYDERV